LDWRLFFLTYGMLFLAEIGDKTQLAVFSLVTQYRSPMPVFLGASLAMATVTLIGALFGSVVARYIPAAYLRFFAGLMFVGIGALILWHAVRDIIR